MIETKHKCKFGTLLPLRITGTQTSFVLIGKHGEMISDKLRCGHGIAKPHCRICNSKRKKHARESKQSS